MAERIDFVEPECPEGTALGLPPWWGQLVPVTELTPAERESKIIGHMERVAREELAFAVEDAIKRQKDRTGDSTCITCGSDFGKQCSRRCRACRQARAGDIAVA